MEIQVVMKDLEKLNRNQSKLLLAAAAVRDQPAAEAAAARTVGLRSDLTDRTCSELEANICVSHVVKCFTEQ